jgi:hypothetical protein
MGQHPIAARQGCTRANNGDMVAKSRTEHGVLTLGMNRDNAAKSLSLTASVLRFLSRDLPIERTHCTVLRSKSSPQSRVGR